MVSSYGYGLSGWETSTVMEYLPNCGDTPPRSIFVLMCSPVFFLHKVVLAMYFDTSLEVYISVSIYTLGGETG